MSEEPFVVELAGRRWELPHLPFRLIKAIQPSLSQVYAETAGAADAPLNEAQLDNLAGAAWRAIAFVEPTLTYEAFLGLPFSIADLLANLPMIAQASGLRLQTATPEASPGLGK